MNVAVNLIGFFINIVQVLSQEKLLYTLAVYEAIIGYSHPISLHSYPLL